MTVSSGFEFDESKEFWQEHKEPFIACDKETGDKNKKEEG